MSSRQVLIIDSDYKSAEALGKLVAAWGYEVLVEQAGDGVIARMSEIDPSVIIAGSSGSSEDGFSLLREIRSQQPETPVVLLTGDGSVEMAVTAIQEEGAYHYFEKPVDSSKLRIVLDRAVELGEAKRENEVLRRQLQDRGAFGELVGNSESMREIYALIEQVAPSSASVLADRSPSSPRPALRVWPRRSASMAA